MYICKVKSTLQMINLINNKMGVENVPFGCGLVDSPEASIILKSTNMIEEIYKDIPGYEGIYQVSNLGNVKSLPRKIVKGRAKFISKEKFLKYDKTDKYFNVSLFKDGKKKTIRVHVLVAMAFLGHVPNGHKIEVDHKNDIKTDNSLENLQLLSGEEHRRKPKKSMNTSSQYIGVCWDKCANKWMSYIKINRKFKNLGLFTDEYEAHLAYQKALKMYNYGDLSFMELKKKSSKYIGVSWHKKSNKWIAYITINDKRKHLGLFKTEIEACEARQKYLNELINN